jgi:hypothetical protein
MSRQTVEQADGEYTFRNPYVGYHQWCGTTGSNGYSYFEVFKDQNCWWWSEVDMGCEHTGSRNGPFPTPEDSYYDAQDLGG